MNWISVKDHLPTENGDYFVTISYLCGSRYVKSVSWANDLHELNKWDFPIEDYEGVGGFYYCDSEWGYCEVDDVLAWCEAKPYEGD